MSLLGELVGTDAVEARLGALEGVVAELGLRPVADVLQPPASSASSIQLPNWPGEEQEIGGAVKDLVIAEPLLRIHQKGYPMTWAGIAAPPAGGPNLALVHYAYVSPEAPAGSFTILHNSPEAIGKRIILGSGENATVAPGETFLLYYDAIGGYWTDLGTVGQVGPSGLKPIPEGNGLNLAGRPFWSEAPAGTVQIGLQGAMGVMARIIGGTAATSFTLKHERGLFLPVLTVGEAGEHEEELPQVPTARLHDTKWQWTPLSANEATLELSAALPALSAAFVTILGWGD